MQLGKDIVSNMFKGVEGKEVALCFTHLHPDHTQAYPFFAPNYIPGTKMYLIGMEALNKDVGKVLKDVMLPPQFPIELKDLKSTKVVSIVKTGSSFKSLKESMKVDVLQSFAPSHPQQGCCYYRITDISSGKSVVCAWDLESKAGGDKALINFAKDCDLIIHDTQYTDEEYSSDKMIVQGFGHSTYTMAIDNAKQCNAKALACIHFNPNHDDNKLDTIYNSIRNDFNLFLAKEGFILDI